MTSSLMSRGLNRRRFLLGSAALLATSQVGSAQNLLTGGIEPKFMQVSNLLVNHRLSPAVGARIAAFATTQYPELDGLLDQIAAAAAARQASRVEDFFDDLPEGQLRDFAYWIIHSWYTGSSAMDRKATLFTYEEALLYQPTIDMVPIPTFGLSGPNAWGNDLFPLSDLPQF